MKGRGRDRSRSPDRRSGNGYYDDRGGGGGGGGERETGEALRWSEKGFGFIKPDNDSGDGDLFCHFSAITDGRCLKEGTKVEFTRSFDEKRGKYRAENVTGGFPEDRDQGKLGSLWLHKPILSDYY